MKQNNSFYVIGITGGVGAGKSVVLDYLKENYPCEILIADKIGNEVKEPGGRCYEGFVHLLGSDVLNEDGSINRSLAAEKIFGNEELLNQVNALIHPAVKEEITERISAIKQAGKVVFVFIEAALLIEAGYKSYLDELWYVSAGADLRSKRLQKQRNYSVERINGIMEQQLSPDEFKRHADRIIINEGTIQELWNQIDKIMGEYTCQEQ